MKFKSIPIILGLFFLYASQGHSQTPGRTLISADFKEASFEQFIQTIEKKTGYQFYFNASDVDSIRVTLASTQQPLDALLASVFQGSDLQYAIDGKNRVFITKGFAIQTTLPNAFFRPGAPDSTAAKTKTVAASRPAPPRPGRATVAPELRLYEVGTSGAAGTTGTATLSGRIRNARTGAPVAGATVYSASPPANTTTDQAGYYALTLPYGKHTLFVRGLGLQATRRQVLLQSAGQLDVEVSEEVNSLREVVIEAEKDKNVSSTQMGVERLDIKTIRQVPTAFGETDILRVVLTLPGVKSVGEGSTGLNVRGGATDQNLILFNDAPIYNPSHLFGLFSAFNPDILQGVELYKSAIPAKYGGRLSSILDITTREGDKKKLSGSGGIGLLTSRLTLETPIVKDKSSVMVSGRSSYSDWLLQKLPNNAFKESAASFYDVSAVLSHTINANNSLHATGYISRDKFKLASDTLYKYSNLAASLKWKHTFSERLLGIATGTFSRYEYSVANDKNVVNASKLQYSLNQSSVRLDFNYLTNSRHTINFGFNSTLYNISPGTYGPLGAESLIKTTNLAREQALESALYISDDIEITRRFAVSLGLRYSFYNALGPRSVYEYLPDAPRTEATITDTVAYKNNEVLATYHGPEYRISAKYALTDNLSVKASFNRTRQYIHMLTNTASVSPTDSWKLSDNNIRPQVGDQVSLGVYKNFKSNTIETSVETYYRNMRDFLDYKSGANLILNPHIETDVLNAQAKAYGVEVMVKKLSGKINGWASYTYSRSLVQLNTGSTADMINGGRYYPTNFDKPHDVTVIGNYRFSRRFSTSLNLTYSTGRPITLPLAKYYVNNTLRVFYSDRNSYRVPDYYRVDFAMNIEGSHKIQKLAHSFWTISVYNVTGRNNPYSVYYRSENGVIKGYQLSIFAYPVPTVTYNFKF